MNDGDVDYGIEIPEIYDGVAVWVLKDGTRVNRFANWSGWEHRAARVQAWLDNRKEVRDDG